MSEEEQRRFERYYSEQLIPRWKRLKEIKVLERKYEVENVGSWPNCRLLYHNSTLSYVYGNYLASIVTISSAIESYLFSKIPQTYWNEEFNQKDWKRLSLGWIISIAEKKEIISNNIIRELRLFSDTIRNNVVHSRNPIGFETLGFIMTSFTSFESPNGEPILPIPPDEAAFQGIDLFLRTVREILFDKSGANNS